MGLFLVSAFYGTTRQLVSQLFERQFLEYRYMKKVFSRALNVTVALDTTLKCSLKYLDKIRLGLAFSSLTL